MRSFFMSMIINKNIRKNRTLVDLRSKFQKQHKMVGSKIEGIGPFRWRHIYNLELWLSSRII